MHSCYGSLHACCYLSFYKVRQALLEFPTFFSLNSSSPGSGEINTSKSSGIFKLWPFTCPIFASPSLLSSLTYFSRFLATNDQALMWLAVSSISSRTTCIRQEAFPSLSTLCETCPWVRQISCSINVPVVIDAAFLQYIQGCMSDPGNVPPPICPPS